MFDCHDCTQLVQSVCIDCLVDLYVDIFASVVFGTY